MISNTQDGMVLRTGTAADATAAAALHAGQIGEGFLALLGPAFLRRLYRRIVRSPGSFLLVVDDGATTVGFLAGSTDVTGLYRSFLARDGVATVLICGGHLVRAWRRVLETLRHGAGTAESGIPRGAELLAIAVDPAVRRRGVGALLVHEFLAETIRRRQDGAHVVVGADNETAIALYRSAGFRTAQRFELHQGTESLLMQWTAPSAAGPF
jgi:ribosomal protein S18 acetylase RimI-like enzyme